MKMLLYGVIMLFALSAVAFLGAITAPTNGVNSFEECIAAGYPAMESYPRQCNDGNQTFVENISDKFCGTSTNGACITDSDCKTSGCSGQICQSNMEPGMVTTCQWKECFNNEFYKMECGCNNGQCQWTST